MQGVVVGYRIDRTGSHPESPGGDCVVPEVETSNFSIRYRKARV